MDDGELLDAWQSGSSEAGDQLLRRHFDELYRFFRNKVDDGVDDLIQNTLLALVRGRDQFRRQCSFRSFLYVVARHELHRFFRAKSRDRVVLDPDETAVSDLLPSPSSVLAHRKEHRLLLTGLRHIPLDLQIALELHYWEELSTQELAEILEIPQGTVKSRLRRAREALQGVLPSLAEDAGQLRSTVDNLDRWAQGVREQVSPAA